MYCKLCCIISDHGVLYYITFGVQNGEVLCHVFFSAKIFQGADFLGAPLKLSRGSAKQIHILGTSTGAGRLV